MWPLLGSFIIKSFYINLSVGKLSENYYKLNIVVNDVQTISFTATLTLKTNPYCFPSKPNLPIFFMIFSPTDSKSRA